MFLLVYIFIYYSVNTQDYIDVALGGIKKYNYWPSAEKLCTTAFCRVRLLVVYGKYKLKVRNSLPTF